MDRTSALIARLGDLARSVIVTACALALIAAGQVLPL